MAVGCARFDSVSVCFPFYPAALSGHEAEHPGFVSGRCGNSYHALAKYFLDCCAIILSGPVSPPLDGPRGPDRHRWCLVSYVYRIFESTLIAAASRSALCGASGTSTGSLNMPESDLRHDTTIG